MGCVSTKNSFYENGTIDNVRHNAIIDFLSRKKQVGSSNLFSVDYLILPNYPDHYVFRISAMQDTFCINPKASQSKAKLESGYLEIDGKLFFWDDESRVITDTGYNLFKKYNLVIEDRSCNFPIRHGPSDDKKVNAHYYFCKNNFKKYKVRFTYKAIGSYEVPGINCR